MAGLLTGGIRIILGMVYPAPSCGPDVVDDRPGPYCDVISTNCSCVKHSAKRRVVKLRHSCSPRHSLCVLRVFFVVRRHCQRPLSALRHHPGLRDVCRHCRRQHHDGAAQREPGTFFVSFCLSMLYCTNRMHRTATTLLAHRIPMNSYHLQLRRVTWWTRKSVLEPDLTDDEDFEDDEEPEPVDPDAPSECTPRAQCKQC